MEREERTYTLSEIAAKTGFDQRTIAYYVQEGLLPRVGRRGRSTRYAKPFVDRLVFIRRVRDLQDSGRMRSVTLGEIRNVLDDLSPREVHDLTRKGADEARLQELFEPDELPGAPEFEEAAIGAAEGIEVDEKPTDARVGSARGRRARLLQRFEGARAGEAEEAPQPARIGSSRAGRSRMATAQAMADVDRIQQLLTQIEAYAQQERGERDDDSTHERVTRVPIGDSTYLSVKDLGEEHAALVEELARLLRGRLGD